MIQPSVPHSIGSHSTVIEAFADLLQYPTPGSLGRIQQRIDEIREVASELEDGLALLLEYSATRPETELEEIFTRTFDSNAERALEMGWHLHGENYARGVFMVRMRKLLRDHGVPESTELPDHVSHVLLVLARADEVLARALATGVLTPALAKVEDGFPKTENPYLGVITSLQKFLRAEYGADSEGSKDD